MCSWTVINIPKECCCLLILRLLNERTGSTGFCPSPMFNSRLLSPSCIVTWTMNRSELCDFFKIRNTVEYFLQQGGALYIFFFFFSLSLCSWTKEKVLQRLINQAFSTWVLCIFILINGRSRWSAERRGLGAKEWVKGNVCGALYYFVVELLRGLCSLCIYILYWRLAWPWPLFE